MCFMFEAGVFLRFAAGALFLRFEASELFLRFEVGVH